MTEKELISLVENRGVGIYPFKDVIDEMVDYVSNILKRYENSQLPIKYVNKEKKEIPFNPLHVRIPQVTIKKITWIKNLIVNVYINNLIGSEDDIMNREGYGDTSHSDKYVTDNETGEAVLFYSEVNIYCYAYKFQLYPRTIYNTLYHEFNHQWDNLNRIRHINNGAQNAKDLVFTLNKLNYNDVMSAVNSKDKEISAFATIVYRLFIPTEFNALVSSIYGDLKAINSQFFSTDIKRTASYKLYLDLKDKCLPLIENASLEKWKEFSSLDIVRKSNIEGFKERFISDTEYKLNDLLYKLAKTASLYYEDINKGTHEYRDGVGGLKYKVKEPLKEAFDYNIKQVEKFGDRVRRTWDIMYYTLK
jgi:hypothetical protein